MTPRDNMGSSSLERAAGTLAVGYAKRMLEGQYSKAMDTDLGRRLRALPRPNQYAIEAALNGVVAYLATLEAKAPGSPVRDALWELAKDFPPEVAIRMMNGEAAKPEVEIESEVEEKVAVLEGLLKMSPEDLGSFLSWLAAATPEERHRLSVLVSKLSLEEQTKLSQLSPDQREMLLRSALPPEPPIAGHDEPRPTPVAEVSVLSKMVQRLRDLNERLEDKGSDE